MLKRKNQVSDYNKNRAPGALFCIHIGNVTIV